MDGKSNQSQFHDLVWLGWVINDEPPSFVGQLIVCEHASIFQETLDFNVQGIALHNGNTGVHSFMLVLKFHPLQVHLLELLQNLLKNEVLMVALV